MPADDLMIPFEGTRAASHVVTLVGSGSDGMFVANQGALMPNGDGTAYLESDLRLRLADGTSVRSATRARQRPVTREE